MLCVVLWVWNLYLWIYYSQAEINAILSYSSFIGFVMGGIQSLSRSTYAKLMPETKDTVSFFSFYDVTEKIAAVIGLFIFGFITELTGSQRASVLALMTIFIIGFFLLLYTRNAAKEDQSMKLYSINTGYFKLDGGAMFGVVPKTIWNKINPADENNLCSWALRCLLIEDGIV